RSSAPAASCENAGCATHSSAPPRTLASHCPKSLPGPDFIWSGPGRHSEQRRRRPRARIATSLRYPASGSMGSRLDRLLVDLAKRIRTEQRVGMEELELGELFRPDVLLRRRDLGVFGLVCRLIVL